MTDERTEQDEIDDYRRVEAFLAEPAVKRAIKTVQDGVMEQFRASTTPLERETLHAKLKAMDAFAGELIATMDAGKLAMHKRQQREMREAATRRMPERRK